jgi:glycine/D-amino acid oxidase-like deaminating enzyme/nitrite reductase/ring-hydroxylating ferredoxin subunit
MQTLWSATTILPHFPTLAGEISTDVAVIGGGMAGILTAFSLGQRGVNAVVLEAATIGSGQTRGTTAKITAQHGLIYADMLANMGKELSQQYAAAHMHAIADYRRIAENLDANCALENRPAYIYSQTPRDLPALEAEAHAAQTLGIPAEFVSSTELPFSVAGGVRFPDQAQFHPLSFLGAVARNLEIYEHSRVQRIEGDRLHTAQGSVRAKQVVIAAHFPFRNIPGFYFARMHQSRSYVLTLDKAPTLSGMYLGIDSDGLSLRSYGDRLLLGGGGHRTGRRTAQSGYAPLRRAARRYYPGCAEQYRWSAQDCMTLDGLPYIGRFSAATPNWYVATGFGKWGMSSSMVAANLISDLITGVDNPFEPVFSPLRFTPKASADSFFTNLSQSAGGLSRQLLFQPKSRLNALPPGYGGIVQVKGHKLGAYRDEGGRVYLVSTRCTHLGCQLEWNPDEKSWDCPCHGSRFDYTGRLICGPAQTDLKRYR